MFTVPVGKRLIACVNARDGTERTPREFFDEIYFPLFFGSPRFLQYVNNSPFAQASILAKKNKTPLTIESLCEARSKVHVRTETETPDGSFYLGGPAKGTLETTSGQVSNLERQIPPDDVYASWIGAALGIGINGGLSLLIEDDAVLLALFDGWSRYRRLLDQTPALKPMQIDAWNGQWLTWRFGRAWDEDGIPPLQTDGDAASGQALKTQTWVHLLFALAYHFRHQTKRELTAYAYTFGQMNRTVGFIRLNLPEVRRPFDLYRQLFTVPVGLALTDFERLYETELSFLAACEQGSIGLRSLEPKGLRKFLPERRGGAPSKPAKITLSAAAAPEQQLSGQIYLTWIIAMLNNKDLLDRAEVTAKALHAHTKLATDRGKREHSQRVEEALNVGTRRAFIEALTRILQADGEQASLFNKVVEDVVSMPESNVPLFLTLVRFKYAYVSQQPAA